MVFNSFMLKYGSNFLYFLFVKNTIINYGVRNAKEIGLKQAQDDILQLI